MAGIPISKVAEAMKKVAQAPRPISDTSGESDV